MLFLKIPWNINTLMVWFHVDHIFIFSVSWNCRGRMGYIQICRRASGSKWTLPMSSGSSILQITSDIVSRSTFPVRTWFASRLEGAFFVFAIMRSAKWFVSAYYFCTFITAAFFWFRSWSASWFLPAFTTWAGSVGRWCFVTIFIFSDIRRSIGVLRVISHSILFI